MNKFSESEGRVPRVLMNHYLCFLQARRSQAMAGPFDWETTDRFCTMEVLWTVFAAMALGNGARTARAGKQEELV